MQAFLGLSGIDGYIVTIALSRGFIMASRDTASFKLLEWALSIPGKKIVHPYWPGLLV